MKKTLLNNQIRARKVRLIDEAGEQLGVFPTEQALNKARERGLDLVQVTQKTDPPVCKIIDRGKYLYQLQKKEKKKSKKKGGEIKGVRLKFNTSSHDLETKAKQAEKFLQQGNKVKLEMLLRGREKALRDRIRSQIDKFLELLKEKISIETEQESKKQKNAITIIIKKGKNEEKKHSQDEEVPV